MNLKFKKLNETAVLPYRATQGSAGYDLFSTETIELPEAKCVKVHTSLAVEIPQGFVGLIFPRSSVAVKRSIRLANCVAVIDSDYRGELLVPLYKDGFGNEVVLEKERIAQLVVVPFFSAESVFCDELSETDRGSGGFGSTGN